MYDVLKDIFFSLRIALITFSFLDIVWI